MVVDRLHAPVGLHLDAVFLDLRLENCLGSDLVDGLLVVLAHGLVDGLLDDGVLGAVLLGARGLLGDSGEHIVLAAHGLLAQWAVGTCGLGDGDLDDVAAGGAGTLAEGLVLHLHVSCGYLNHGLLGLADRCGLVGSGDHLLVHSSGLLVALLGVHGHLVGVGLRHGLVSHVLLLDHLAGAATFLVPHLGNVGGTDHLKQYSKFNLIILINL